MNDDLQQQLIKDLLIESFEGLDRFDREVLAMEKGQAAADTPNIIFRVIHTLKGTAGCLGLSKIESVAHVGENLLSLLRDGELTASPPLIGALLEYSDALKAILRCLENTGEQGEADYSALLNKLQALQSEPQAPAQAADQGWGLFEDAPAAPAPAPAQPAEAAPPVAAAPVPPAAQPAAAAAPKTPPPPAPAPPPAAEKENASRPAQSVSDTAIRVDVGQLDKLMNLVGELVLARNQIVQFTAQSQEPTLLNASQRLNLITTELQESVMKTRMQPIGNVWAKFPRIVRDVAHELGKEVQLVMDGNETELDRTIIEAIKDPMTHVIRNSIDHGIEKPAVRSAAHKPEKGLLQLRAFHEGGQVIIEIIDDGAGIDTAKVKAKAVERSLLSADQAARLSDRESLNLIFLPGLSTAEKITSVSGRGVGMDVVKTNIEKIGGSVDIQSILGQGTTLRFKIPLTLAIIPALIITSRSERFAIPQVSLVELVRLEGEQARKGIEFVFNAPVYRLRGKLLPLVYLNTVLRLDEGSAAAAATEERVASIIVLKAGEQQFGLVVDAINDTQEIVVKPLGKHLKGLPVFAGATIMGDGTVALILDVFGLAQHAEAISRNADSKAAEAAAPLVAGEHNARQTLLVFSLGPEHRLAMPLSSVGRLEKFPAATIEREGSREVVQYRGQIMPLVRLSGVLGAGGDIEQTDLPVVVYSAEGRNLGLVVGRIEDIIEDRVTIQNQNHRPGVLGSAVIQGKVTEMVDVPAIVQTCGN